MFKALRTFKVQNKDGSYRQVVPGEDLPEAAEWRHLESYIRRRWITNEEGQVYNGRHFVSYVAPKKAIVGVAEKPAPVIEQMPKTVDVQKKYTIDQLELMKKSQLIQLAEAQGLSPYGSKMELVRLLMGDQA